MTRLSHSSLLADPTSYAFDRISLRLVERKPMTGAEITGDSVACTGSVVNFLAKGVEANVVYSIWDDDVLLSSIKAEDEDSIQFSFPTDGLRPGHHNLRLQAQSTCHVLPQIADHALTIDSIPNGVGR